MAAGNSCADGGADGSQLSRGARDVRAFLTSPIWWLGRVAVLLSGSLTMVASNGAPGRKWGFAILYGCRGLVFWTVEPMKSLSAKVSRFLLPGTV